jgi:alkylated DNA nucleotide flippase Atl1
LDSCDSRVRAYRNGKTFDQCRQEARQVADVLAQEIAAKGEVAWSRVLEAAGHDEIVYKLALKYLREQGHDIGNFQVPRVKR